MRWWCSVGIGVNLPDKSPATPGAALALPVPAGYVGHPVVPTAERVLGPVALDRQSFPKFIKRRR